MKFAVSSIVTPKHRLRPVGDFSAIADSMSKVGLLNPIVVTKTKKLVAGAHRLAAARHLGWDEIDVHVVDSDDLHVLLAEIDENLIRNELTVLERAEHLAKRKEIYEELWPETRHGGAPGKAGGGKEAKGTDSVSFVQDTAAKTHRGTTTVKEELQIAKVLGPILDQLRGTPVEDRKADLLKLARMGEVERDAVVKKIVAGSNSVKDAKKAISREAKTASSKQQKDASDKWKLIHAAVDDLGEISDNSVDCIVTDPPYPREFVECYAALSETAARVLRPGGSCVVMCGQSYLPELMERMGRHLEYHWTAAYLTPGGQAVQLWDRKVNTFWKPLLWYMKPPAKPEEWQGDVLGSKTNDNDKRFHDWGQSESGMAAIVDRFTFPGQTILDPFCGGGTTGVVCVKLGRMFIGSDCDESQINIAKTRLQEVE